MKIRTHIGLFLPLILAIAACVELPKTTQFDQSLPYAEIDGYKFHSEAFGNPKAPTVIVVHGGPGADFGYLRSLEALSDNHHVVFYDQRGTGLSPRVQTDGLTLEQNLEDLHSIVQYYAGGKKVKLIGHSWGGMLVAGYLSTHPEQVSQAVMIEPGMLFPDSARAFVAKMKASQSISSLFALGSYVMVYPFVVQTDKHEGFDYVLTKLYNRNVSGGPYQCEGESMPPNSFGRGGYEAFNNMLKPVMDDATAFTYDLTDGLSDYEGELMLISSECSAFGYEFQKKFHMPKLPRQTVHIYAENMGHNMLTLNPQWGLSIIGEFFEILSR